MIPAPPPPAELPANVVGIVARVPDYHGEQGGVITTTEFGRAMVQLAAVKGLRGAPKPGGKGYRRLRNEAIGELLDGEWIRGQAAEVGLGLRPKGVADQLAWIKREAFESRAEYRRFLREAHYTRRDVEELVEIQMLADRIQERVVFGIRGKAARNRAFARFVSEYAVRWRERTVCSAEFLTVRCANGPAPKRTAGR